MNCVTYSCSKTHFSTISIISVSVNNSDFTSVFYEAAWHANPEAEKEFVGSK